jgi:hypothetical protein
MTVVAKAELAQSYIAHETTCLLVLALGIRLVSDPVEGPVYELF